MKLLRWLRGIRARATPCWGENSRGGFGLEVGFGAKYYPPRHGDEPYTWAIIIAVGLITVVVYHSREWKHWPAC